MKRIKLNPNEILTTKDFPVHSLNTLKIYFKICKENLESVLPPTPVIPFSVGLPLLSRKDKKSKEELKDKAEHFKDAKFFETVEDKTKRMVKEKVIPKYMINYYEGLR